MVSASPPVSFIGNLAADPELRFTPNGKQVANFRIGVTPRTRQDDGTYKDGDTSWLGVIAFGSLAENVAESLRQGDRVVVIGRLQVRQWEDRDGNARTATEVLADEIAPSLAWAIAKVSKTPRRDGGGGGGGGSTARPTTSRASNTRSSGSRTSVAESPPFDEPPPF